MPTVLVVDDSPVVRWALRSQLAAEGLSVVEKSTASEALSVDTTTLLCAVIDLELGDAEGADIAAALVAKRPTLPIAFFTAGAPASAIARASAFGPTFVKPNVEAVVAWAKGHRV